VETFYLVRDRVHNRTVASETGQLIQTLRPDLNMNMAGVCRAELRRMFRRPAMTRMEVRLVYDSQVTGREGRAELGVDSGDQV
jgi:hypothetical protein